MAKLTMFILKDCPYCIRALTIQKELLSEERYRGVEVEIIDEREQPALADRYDYYYVPTYYLAGEKLHEGAADRAAVRAVLERAVS